ncbi:condensation domain-containing protein [Nocardia flavorosea]|uniref:Acyltransferase n=1 Tax=Nocardia flavorosea TaxID=53429 RepID=A0A846Y634_9NOCA|nr:condensation domain-containing protein [Nocardia flavorosea]NKY54663.1 acyltransferase [Nocardia flavorosea]
MVDFGLIDEWNPAPGRVVSWEATSAARAAAAAAPIHSAPPSHQQEHYLRQAHRTTGTGYRGSGLCLVTAEVPAVLDRAAMTLAVNEFLTRHDTFHSWFALEPDGALRRHLMAPGEIEFAPVDHGPIDDAAAIRELAQTRTPGPTRWDCFTFWAVEHDESTTVFMAIDHLHTDGVGQHISSFELACLYAKHAWDQAPPILQPAGYTEYCARERAASARLSLGSPEVATWLRLLRGNDGELPSFPLDLGLRDGGTHHSAHRTVTLFDEDAAARFEKVCRDNGGEFAGGVFAAAALAERELADSDYYFGITPLNTRATFEEMASIGWYVALVPVAFPIGTRATFERTVARAQRAYENGMRLKTTTIHRVLELAPADSGIAVGPNWSNPMISYVDARDFAGSEFFDIARSGLYGNRAPSEEALIWVNRLPAETTISVIYPDNPVAHESVRRYLDTLGRIIRAAATERG